MSRLDPWQREHELAEAIVTLIIAASRYGAGNKRPRPTAARLATLQHVTILVANGVAEKVAAVGGNKTVVAFRRALATRRRRS